MRRHRRTPTLKTATIAAAALAVGLAASCSLLVESREHQCASDADCAAFPGARCDLGGHVCARRRGDAGGSGGAPCDDGSCYRCAPSSNDELLNACTDAACKPFDNGRLKHLRGDGLPPLPGVGGGG